MNQACMENLLSGSWFKFMRNTLHLLPPSPSARNRAQESSEIQVLLR
jgi:hypothetical protein